MTIEPDTDLFLRAVVRLAMDELTFGLRGEPEDPTVAPAARVIPIVGRHLRRAEVGAFEPSRVESA